MRWYGNRRAEKLPHLDKDRILVIDTETTGLRVETNEILQITVLDGYGSQLLHSYIKPYVVKPGRVHKRYMELAVKW